MMVVVGLVPSSKAGFSLVSATADQLCLRQHHAVALDQSRSAAPCRLLEGLHQ